MGKVFNILRNTSLGTMSNEAREPKQNNLRKDCKLKNADDSRLPSVLAVHEFDRIYWKRPSYISINYRNGVFVSKSLFPTVAKEFELELFSPLSGHWARLLNENQRWKPAV